MFICITNDKTKDPSMYDQYIDLNTLEGSIVLDGWLISRYGITNNGSIASSKNHLQRSYKKGINQIVCNDRITNVTYETETGEIIEFVGINNHIEKE